ncbi:MAG: hypothetical protein WBA12_10615, partial [Catalinimonas sp.]
QQSYFGPFMFVTSTVLLTYTVWVYRRLLDIRSVGGTLRIVASMALGIVIYGAGAGIIGIVIGICVALFKLLTQGA